MSQPRRTKTSKLKLGRREWDFRRVENEHLPACLCWEYFRECAGPSFEMMVHFRYTDYDSDPERSRFNTALGGLPTRLRSYFGQIDGCQKPWAALTRAKQNEIVKQGPLFRILIPVSDAELALRDQLGVARSENTDVDERHSDLTPSETVVTEAKGNLDKNSVRDDFEAPHFLKLAATEGTDEWIAIYRACGLMPRPPFLLNCLEFSKAEIKRAFEKWFDDWWRDSDIRRSFNPALTKRKLSASSMRRSLNDLGMLRLLHCHTVKELLEIPEIYHLLPRRGMVREPDAPLSERQKPLYKSRARAKKFYENFFGSACCPEPRNIATKGARSPGGALPPPEVHFAKFGYYKKYN